MKTIKKFEIPAKDSNPSVGLVTYLFILGIGVFAYFMYISISLFNSQNNIPAAFILIIGLWILYLMSIRPLIKRKNAKPLVIEVFENELSLSFAQKNIPFKYIQAKTGDLKIQNINKGWVTEYRVGDALVLKIENFEEFFKLTMGDTFSPLFNEPNCFKIPIGERGLTKEEGLMLLNYFKT